MEPRPEARPGLPARGRRRSGRAAAPRPPSLRTGCRAEDLRVMPPGHQRGAQRAQIDAGSVECAAARAGCVPGWCSAGIAPEREASAV